MAMLAGDKAFSLEQELTVEQQETVDDDLVKEAYRQRGLLLLSADVEGGRFQRVIEEFLLADEAYVAVQGRGEVGFAELRRLHDEAVADRKVELHVTGGLEIESDLASRDVAIRPGPAAAGHDPPVEPESIPAFVLYWPTVTPVLSEEDAKPGEGWRGKIAVQIGAGEFTLAYAVTLVEYVEEDPLLEISLDEKEQVATVGVEADIALHLTPRGSWTVRISHEDGIWQEGTGEMAFSVRAKYKEDEDDEEEIEFDVLKWTNKFAVERIPVTFDDERIYPAEWKPQAASVLLEAGHAAAEGGGRSGEGPGNDTHPEAPPSSPGESAGSEQEAGGRAEDPT